MKRDLEFVRDFLLRLENSDETMFVHAEVLIDDGKDLEVLPAGWDWKTNYHFELLKDAGFVKEIDWPFSPEKPYEESGIVGLKKFRVTNAGHDYLDAIRDEGIWEKTIGVVADSGGNVTIEILKSLAVGLLKNKIRQHTDIEI